MTTKGETTTRPSRTGFTVDDEGWQAGIQDSSVMLTPVDDDSVCRDMQDVVHHSGEPWLWHASPPAYDPPPSETVWTSDNYGDESPGSITVSPTSTSSPSVVQVVQHLPEHSLPQPPRKTLSLPVARTRNSRAAPTARASRRRYPPFPPTHTSPQVQVILITHSTRTRSASETANDPPLKGNNKQGRLGKLRCLLCRAQHHKVPSLPFPALPCAALPSYSTPACDEATNAVV